MTKYEEIHCVNKKFSHKRWISCLKLFCIFFEMIYIWKFTEVYWTDTFNRQIIKNPFWNITKIALKILRKFLILNKLLIKKTIGYMLGAHTKPKRRFQGFRGATIQLTSWYSGGNILQGIFLFIFIKLASKHLQEYTNGCWRMWLIHLIISYLKININLGYFNKVQPQPIKSKQYRNSFEENIPEFICAEVWPSGSLDLNPFDYLLSQVLEAKAWKSPTEIWSSWMLHLWKQRVKYRLKWYVHA